MNTSRYARRAVLAGACTALLLTAAPGAFARKKQAEIPPATLGLVDNVNGLAVGKNGELEFFTGLLIRAEGKVERRLARGETRPERLAYRLDGKGRTLIPSFVDSHAQVIATGIALMTLDLAGTRSLAEAQARIAAYVRDNPGRKWILGRGWDPALWGGGGAAAQLPTAQDLDNAVADIPAWLLSADGRIGWANSATLRLAKIDSAQGSGSFTGTVKQQIDRVVPAPVPKDRDVAFDKAQRSFIARGISAVADIGTTLDDWQAYRRAGDRGALRLRIVGYADGLGNMVTIAGSEPSPWLYGDRLKLNGIAIEIDERSDGTRLRNQISRAAMDGFQVALAPEDTAASREAVAAIAEVSETYGGDRRWRLQLDKSGDGTPLPNGLVAVLTGRKLDAMPLSGPEGQPALATGGPALRQAPLALIARMMQTNGSTLAPALAAFTGQGAHAMFANDRIGGLRPGQWADFLLLDRDISSASAGDIAATQILEHWIGGKRVWAQGEN